jgi:hypothetical protein
VKKEGVKTMTVEQMRNYLVMNSKYKSDKWAEKVKQMSDNQVIAVYTKFINKGEIK